MQEAQTVALFHRELSIGLARAAFAAALSAAETAYATALTVALEKESDEHAS